MSFIRHVRAVLALSCCYTSIFLMVCCVLMIPLPWITFSILISSFSDIQKGYERKDSIVGMKIDVMDTLAAQPLHIATDRSCYIHLYHKLPQSFYYTFEHISFDEIGREIRQKSKYLIYDEDEPVIDERTAIRENFYFRVAVFETQASFVRLLNDLNPPCSNFTKKLFRTMNPDFDYTIGEKTMHTGLTFLNPMTKCSAYSSEIWDIGSSTLHKSKNYETEVANLKETYLECGEKFDEILEKVDRDIQYDIAKVILLFTLTVVLSCPFIICIYLCSCQFLSVCVLMKLKKADTEETDEDGTNQDDQIELLEESVLSQPLRHVRSASDEDYVD